MQSAELAALRAAREAESSVRGLVPRRNSRAKGVGELCRVCGLMRRSLEVGGGGF